MHYMMDLFYQVEGDTEPRQKSYPFVAAGDDSAITEAQRFNIWEKAAYFKVRKVFRNRDQVIHDSRRP